MLEGYKMEANKPSFLTEAAEMIKQAEKRDMMLRMLDEQEGVLRKLFKEHIETGFTEEQAWELINRRAAYTPI